MVGLPVQAARELLRERLAELPRVRAIVGDRAYRGLARLAERKHVRLDVKAPPKGVSGFVPIRPLYKIEHAFAQLGRWRRLARCYEGSAASARALARGRLGRVTRLAGGGLTVAGRSRRPASSSPVRPASLDASGPLPTISCSVYDALTDAVPLPF